MPAKLAIGTTIGRPVGRPLCSAHTPPPKRNRRATPGNALAGIVAWCADAFWLRDLLSRRDNTYAEVAIWSNDPDGVSAECVRARVLPFDQRLAQASRAHLQRLDTEEWCHANVGGPQDSLMKWNVVGAATYGYRAVFFFDIDVSLVHHEMRPSMGHTARTRVGERLARAWHLTLETFLREGRSELLVSHDWASPVNTGVMLVKPTADAYERGIELLRSPFDFRRGFNRSGSPRSRQPDPSYVQRCAETAAFREDSWCFHAAAVDQGLFAAVFLFDRRTAVPSAGNALRKGLRPLLPLGLRGHRTEAPTEAAAAGTAARAPAEKWQHKVHHFWGTSKPWYTARSPWRPKPGYQLRNLPPHPWLAGECLQYHLWQHKRVLPTLRGVATNCTSLLRETVSSAVRMEAEGRGDERVGDGTWRGCRGVPWYVF